MPEHGTRARYLRGCRCEPCADAHRRYCKTYRLRTDVNYERHSGVFGRPNRPMRIPVGPIRDHLHALLASGWTKAAIVREITGGPNNGAHIYRILRGDQQRVHRTVAARILELEPFTPTGPDEVAVQRLIKGLVDWRELTHSERVEAARQMDASGVSRVEIARKTHLRSQTLRNQVYAQRGQRQESA